MLGYPFTPHHTNAVQYFNRVPTSVKTEAEIRPSVVNMCEIAISSYLQFYIDDALHLAVLNAVNHTTDTDTLGFARARIPQGMNDDTLRFLIAFLHEKSVGLPLWVDEVVSQYSFVEKIGYYQKTSGERVSYQVRQHLLDWTKTALAIMENMKTYRALVGDLVNNTEFMRESALVEAGREVGIKLETTGNIVAFGYRNNNALVYHQLAINSSINLLEIDGLRYPTTPAKNNETDTCTITSLNGGSELRLKTSTEDVKEVLNPDTPKTFAVADMMKGITTRAIAPPIVAVPLDDVRFNQRDRISIPLNGVFSGEYITRIVAEKIPASARMTVSVANNLSAVTLSGHNTNQKGSIKLTAYNPTGSASLTFKFDIR